MAYLWNACVLLPHFVHELFHEVHGFDDEVGGGGVAAADEAFSGFAKGIARDDGDALLFKKAEGEFLAGEAGATDLWEDVEGSTRASCLSSLSGLSQDIGCLCGPWISLKGMQQTLSSYLEPIWLFVTEEHDDNQKDHGADHDLGGDA